MARNWQRAMDLNADMFKLKVLTMQIIHICAHYHRFVNVKTGVVYHGQ